MLSSPPRIDLLPEHLIDQIKAGEVIERPGNLIKEILENAIDAGATKLELTLRNNGLDLISLKDNGHGMRRDDLPLAFSRHATSKISRFEDLYRLHTFGFRGEALASIAAIAKVQCLSKVSGEAQAEIRIEGGLTVYHGERKTSDRDHGTELVIQELFYNTPARLKFIQGQQSEKTYIKKIVFAFILSNPEIEFQIRLDETEKEIFPARENLRDRLKDIFPKAKESMLLKERFYENCELELYLIPGSYKGPFKIQNIFINDRYILDKQLHRVLTSALESAMGSDDWHYIACISLPPDSIDVNVHPNKTIIKIMESAKLISLISSTVKDLVPQRQTPGGADDRPYGTQLPAFSLPTEAPVLQQERHKYNMEGLFSPHKPPEKTPSATLWINRFLITDLDGKTIAVSAPALLEAYMQLKLKKASSMIPLLVSEPFQARLVKKEALEKLTACGFELEYLGADTIVLRSIPEWMNGFPLKDAVSSLLYGIPLSETKINPADWSMAAWEEMLSAFSGQELFSSRIMVNLEELLKEKLR